MHFRLLSVILCLFVALSVACSRQDSPPVKTTPDGRILPAPDEVLISIDGNDLTYAQATRQVEKRLGGPPPKGMDPERIAQIERRTFAAVVDDFIRRELLLAEARRLGIEPPDEQINKAMETIEKTSENGGQQPSGLIYDGPDSLRREVVAGLTIETLLAQNLPPFEIPSDEAIENHLQEYPDMREIPARARARHIFIRVDPDTNPQEVAQRTTNLEDVRKNILNGADFAQTAKMISQDGSAARGGDIGIVVKGAGDPTIVDAAFSQPVGDVGPVFRSNAGLHILQVMERSDARPATKQEITGLMQRNHRAAAIAKYIDELRQRIEIRHSPLIEPAKNKTKSE